MVNLVKVPYKDVWVKSELIRKVSLSGSKEGELTITVTLMDGEEVSSSTWNSEDAQSSMRDLLNQISLL